MIKLLVWLAGSCGLLWLAWRFSTWHLLVQLVVLAALFLWVVGGGVVLAYRVKHSARTARVAAADIAAVMPADARASYVKNYGEMSARYLEQAHPEVWDNMARVATGVK